MNNHKIHVVGLGVAEFAQLSNEAEHALQQADIVIGSQRQFESIKAKVSLFQCQWIPLPKLVELKAVIAEFSQQEMVILASGDPLYYGIGRWLSHNVSASRLVFYPAVSSIQMACHRLGLSLQDVHVISLHGRPLLSLRPHLRQHRRLLILTDQYSQPQQLADECLLAGFEQSRISVCEKLGYHSERVQHFVAEELVQSKQSFDPLHISVIELEGRGGVFPEAPGIPDHHFITGDSPGKGMISKREVRLCILSMLQLREQDVVWDIGAGCGGVAVELSLWQPAATIYAIECHSQRLSYLSDNQQKFGVLNNLHIIKGRAPEVLGQLPQPSKLFIGGSDGELESILNYAWPLLPPQGIVVASAVTERTKAQLHRFASTLLPEQFESVELSVRRGEAASNDKLCKEHRIQYLPKLPVEIIKFTK